MSYTIKVKGLDKVINKMKHSVEGLPEFIGVRLVELFKDNIENGNQLEMGGGWVKWKNEQATQDIDNYVFNGGKHTLLLRTRQLENSIQLIAWDDKTCKITSDTPYSAILAEGGEFVQTVTDKQRKFFWAMYYKSNNQLWKILALRKTLNIKIPSRNYMEINDNVRKEIDKWINDYIKDEL